MNEHILKSMNKLPTSERIQILSMLVEGSSMRSISRVVGVSINTVTKLLVDAGTACLIHHDKAVRDIKASKVQCDEIWSFNYAKQKNVASAKAAPEQAGDVWTWTAICADSKLMVSWLVGKRDSVCAYQFMRDLVERLAHRVQLTTDGHHAGLAAVKGAFGNNIDFATLVKIYGYGEAPASGGGRYSPPKCLGTKKRVISGKPERKHISTSYAERANLTIRMGTRRFTRLTNGFSKRIENHCHALALYFTFYNFVKMHKTLGGISPAMAAGVSDRLWEMKDILVLVEDGEVPQKRGPYKKAISN